MNKMFLHPVLVNLLRKSNSPSYIQLGFFSNEAYEYIKSSLTSKSSVKLLNIFYSKVTKLGLPLPYPTIFPNGNINFKYEVPNSKFFYSFDLLPSYHVFKYMGRYESGNIIRGVITNTDKTFTDDVITLLKIPIVEGETNAINQAA